MNNKHAGQAIVDSLALHGVERTFVVPGESYLAVLDGLYASEIDTVVCRHEGGAAYMAEAHGKLTGQPGVAMVTRGPGAANAFVALHTAWQDAVPMVLFVGLIPVADRMRESFQEFDPHAWFGTQCKRVFVLDEAERASEVVAEAFFAACSGRPGPVVIGLPEDVITHEVAGELHPVLPAVPELPETRPGTAHMSAVVGELVKRLPADAIYSFGAGNHCAWAQRYLPTRTFPSQLSTRNGSMGYSVPAAVAASLESPERLCVVVAGDGEFMMNGQEIATAMQHGATMLILVMDNGQYGTIRAHQEMHFPERVSGTQLANPDFAALCRAYGGHGETVTANDQAEAAIERALAAVTGRRQPALVHVHTDARHDLP
ncbi:thiamine pyrophosphate-dependent enzyme [Halomonas cerina]|uniref:Thiamine pyrophosphate-dependent acetolactate synthase large subunit-like protein n=1 Tax=Halomonas cerina TaxID=447424 RepID=A0A839VI15_9GAMM|nr:thiamine pyrophosphate-dependent enzyme [Halomonas cerina]MBB3192327.1 thiamine pyrophosphate-dependent acetolactate synthase large subunit-like protein [Halomonas cerina]